MDFKYNTIIEPFRIKMVEAMPLLSTEQRRQVMKEASYNLFTVPARHVTFDLLTDSGTSAMSAEQWAGMMIGDESYAGSKSFEHFEKTIQDLTGLEFIVPTHQGRSAEHLLMRALQVEGKTVIGNTHFDTTRANIETSGGEALDMPSPANKISEAPEPFKGNIDTQVLREYLKKNSSKTSLIIMTVTNNSVGGQPVSMANLKETKKIANEYGIPVFIDCARFAENAFFIKNREEGYKNKSVKSIAQEMFSYSDGALMSAKKDAFGNIGGFLAVKSKELAKTIRSLMVITEGFPTYGGLAGRDLEALAIGLKEIVDEHYLSYRIRSVEYFGQGIEQAGFKTIRPYGGHAVYIDAGLTLPHIPALKFPGQSLSVALYEYIGIRSVEVGTVMLGKRDPKTGEEFPAPKELVRLAIPRRVYTQSHVDYMLEGIQQLSKILPQLPGYEFVEQAPVLRHFTAKFKQTSTK